MEETCKFLLSVILQYLILFIVILSDLGCIWLFW